MAERRTWSLARRLTGLFLLSTTVFVVAISVVSAWFLNQSVQRELESLLPQERAELRDRFGAGIDDEAAFGQFVTELDNRYTPDHLAVRVWEPDGRTVWGEFGNVDLLRPDVPAPEPLEQAQRVNREVRWHSERLANGQIVGLVVDGSPVLGLLERYEAYALVLVGAGSALTLVLSRLFFQRVSALLRTVAERARAVREPDTSVEINVEGAPREIEEVVSALHEMLHNIRRESEEARIFTAGIAHELRSPVQNLVGETEVALMAERDPATYRRVLQSHLEEMRGLGDAIDNLVTICSRGETERTGVREHFELGQEARMRLRREQALAERMGVTFALSVEGDTHIHGDREAILRALRNLAQNAVQWCRERGHVDIAIVGGADAVVVTVDDDGPGVQSHLRTKIFEPFFRGPQSHGRRIGYGLGLALARSAALDQGGSVDVGTSPRNGARFRMVLPKRSAAPR